MILVKTKLDKSHISGIGLFADCEIKQGSVVYLKSPKLDLKLSKEDFNNLNEIEQKTISHYGYLAKDGFYYLDFDDIRFLNHSDNPNLILIGNELRAVRLINSGEELTQNYNEFEDFSQRKI
jgi:SET domain-containing protein